MRFLAVFFFIFFDFSFSLIVPAIFNMFNDFQRLDTLNYASIRCAVFFRKEGFTFFHYCELSSRFVLKPVFELKQFP